MRCMGWSWFLVVVRSSFCMFTHDGFMPKSHAAHHKSLSRCSKKAWERGAEVKFRVAPETAFTFKLRLADVQSLPCSRTHEQ